MASDDAEMPSRYKLGDDLHQINEDLASLRRTLEGLAGDVAATESHQIDNLQSIANGYMRRALLFRQQLQSQQL